MVSSVQISFGDLQEIIDECGGLQKILDSNEVFDFASLTTLCDYLEEKRQAIDSNILIDPMKMLSSRTKVQQLKESRFKGEKKLVDSFVLTSVNKLAILTYQKKETGGTFKFIWAEYLN